MSETEEHKSKIGELNGKWSVLFRALMTICGLMLPFGIWFASWVTMTLFEIKESMAVANAKSAYQSEKIEALRFQFTRVEERIFMIEKELTKLSKQ